MQWAAGAVGQAGLHAQQAGCVIRAGRIACTAGRLCHQGRRDCMHSRQVVSSGQAGLHAQQAGAVGQAGLHARQAGCVRWNCMHSRQGQWGGRIACTAGRLCHQSRRGRELQGPDIATCCALLCRATKHTHVHQDSPAPLTSMLPSPLPPSGLIRPPDLHAAPPPPIRTHPAL